MSDHELAQTAEAATSLPLCFDHPKVSLEAEVSEAQLAGMRDFIRNHPQWDQTSMIKTAPETFSISMGRKRTALIVTICKHSFQIIDCFA